MLLFLISLGYIFAKVKPRALADFADILVQFCVPVLTVIVFAQNVGTPVPLGQFGIMVAGSLSVIGFVALGLYLAVKMMKPSDLNYSALFPSVVFFNAGGLAFHVQHNALGPESLWRGVTLHILNLLVFLTIGVLVIGGWKEVRRNAMKILPFFVAFVIGLSLWICQIQLPKWIIDEGRKVGTVVFVLAPMMVGMGLVGFSLGRSKLILMLSLLRVGGGFLAIYGFALVVLSQFDFGPDTRLTVQTLMIATTMPTSLAALVLPQMFGKGTEIPAAVTVGTLILWLISLPLILKVTLAM